VDLSFKIPEFDQPYNIEEYKKRCDGKHLALIAKINNQPVGFKIGYDRFNDGSLYSWMGGVLPEFRRKEIAFSLADFQENWALENGFQANILKIRKKHKGMVSFSLNRGYIIAEEIQMEPHEESRIWMEKLLSR
jgi:GNAT superfamily N-acetyltransferase